jgi:hypothetical protein
MDKESVASALLCSFVSSYLGSRRLEDRIRTLCARAVATTDPEESNIILRELATALRSHVERLRQMAATRSSRQERRQSHAW